MAKINIEIKRRITIELAVFFLVIILLMGRMFVLQVVQADELQRKAYSQQTKNRTISPNRGTIYDRNGVVLAKSISVETISITPKNISMDNKEKTAKGLADILDLDYETVLAKTNKNSSEEIIAKKMGKEVTDKIREWIKKESIKGINIYEDTKRYYPKGSFLSHALGFCGVDNQGLEGLEVQYESILKGVAGQLIIGADATGRELPLNDEKYIPPEDGLDLILTVDEMIQHIVEKYLEQAMIDNAPVEYGTCIVMDPKTGDVLAMATAPDYDPNDPFTVTDAEILGKWDELTISEKTIARQTMWRNKAIVDTYEPGSVFKTVTSSIAIEEKYVEDVNRVQFSCTGSLKVEGWDIKCWRSYNPHGPQSLRQGLINSCNPVFMSVALKIGKQDFYKYLDAFGVSKRTGIDMPGEGSGVIHNVKDVTDSTLATAAFGQGFTLTPLNMLNIVCSIGNGGNLMQPRIVKEIRDKDGNIIQTNEPKLVKQVVSKETSDLVLDMMKSVVAEGTGRYAQVKGYYVAGKTSTAEQGRGVNKKFVASFIGLAPANDPKVAIIFNLYDPKGQQGHQGGGICAPVVGNILKEVLDYLEIPQDYTYTDDNSNKVTVPDVRNRTVGEATRILNSAGFKYSVEQTDENSKIVSQMPLPGEVLSKKSLVKLYVEGNDTRFSTVVPDVRNMDLLSATKKLEEANLNIKISGSGMSKFQEPAPGTVVEQGTIVRVEFRLVGIDVE